MRVKTSEVIFFSSGRRRRLTASSSFFVFRFLKHNKTMFRVAARRLAPVLATRAVSSLAREGAKASTERAVRKLCCFHSAAFFCFSMVGDFSTDKRQFCSSLLPTLLFDSLFFSRSCFCGL